MRVPRLAEQFESLAKQAHAARLAMWLFVCSELLLFAGLFALYGAYRVMYPAGFMAAAKLNNLTLGTINTFILISSSFTVAMGIHSMRVSRPRWTAALLTATIFLGLTFLVIKIIEYGQHVHHGILPGSHYRFTAMDNPGAKTFFTLYYFMTGLHALHVLGGLAALGWMTVLVRKNYFSAEHHVPLELGGLYWHLVDLIWLFLWPLLYLTR
ncbi:MAG: cytochrome c oxidase subunit 3 [Deltaproteobacteria bacterium]|nr:cytochrome c oxidase subunit 3 [Deltaproteobacteria bacterium]